MKEREKYAAVLRGVGNPDHGQYADVSPRRVVRSGTLAGISRAARRYIKQHGLGGGNFPPAPVYMDGILVGHVSYNGRVWDMKDDDKLLYDP
jgi:hypothetical protein